MERASDLEIRRQQAAAYWAGGLGESPGSELLVSSATVVRELPVQSEAAKLESLAQKHGHPPLSAFAQKVMPLGGASDDDR